MSKLETNTIDTVSGTTNLTIGSTNTSTITMPNGKLTGQNYPAFSARLTSDQTLTLDTLTKVQYNTEEFDTDSAYDNSTNYRFTVPSSKAGKYVISYTNYLKADALTAFSFGDCEIRKNGTAICDNFIDTRNGGNGHQFQINNTVLLDLAVDDYIEIFARISGSGTVRVIGSNYNSMFMGYRIGA